MKRVCSFLILAAMMAAVGCGSTTTAKKPDMTQSSAPVTKSAELSKANKSRMEKADEPKSALSRSRPATSVPVDPDDINEANYAKQFKSLEQELSRDMNAFKKMDTPTAMGK